MFRPDPFAATRRWTYVWDGENRLIAMETVSAVVAALPGLKQRLEFAYDSQGRRIQKQVKTWATSTWAISSDIRFVYDGWNLLGEQDALNGDATIRTHAWGLDLSGSLQGAGGVGGLLWTGTPAAASATGYDANGNIIAYIDTDSGALAGGREYGAFGEIIAAVGAAELPYGFSSKYRDDESSLYYYGFRYYNPSTGRWLSRDPIGEMGGLNLYGVVNNNPIDNTDSLGLIIEKKPFESCAFVSQDKIGEDDKRAWVPEKVIRIVKAPPGSPLPDIKIFKTYIGRRVCRFRCYCEDEGSCRKIPCKDKDCHATKPHGVEIVVYSLSKQQNADAPECTSQEIASMAIRRGKCEY